MQNEAFVYDNSGIMLPTVMTFGEWLREKLNAADLSNAEVARRVGLSPTYIGNLVRDFSANTKSGKVRPSEQVVEALAKAVGASLNEARLAAGYAVLDAIPVLIATEGFAGLTADDLVEIVEFIRFKKAQRASNRPPIRLIELEITPSDTLTVGKKRAK